MDPENTCLSLDEKRLKVNELISLLKSKWSWARIKCGMEGDLAEENHPPALQLVNHTLCFRSGF